MKTISKKTVIAVFAMLALTMLTSCGYFEAQENRKKMENIRIGMTKAEVIKIMGEPPAGVFQTEKIIFYYTNPQWYDGCITRDECCPFVFAEFEDRLVGFGYDYYRKNVMLPDWDKQKLKVRERGK